VAPELNAADLRLVLFVTRQALLDRMREVGEREARAAQWKDDPLHGDLVRACALERQNIGSQSRAYRMVVEAARKAQPKVEWPDIPWDPELAEKG
jgi:hypothetical protein